MTCDDEDPTDTPPTPIPTSTPSPTPTPTPTPLPWYKLKSSSFHSSQPLSNPIPAQITPFDSSDSGETSLIIGGDSTGVVSAEGRIEVAPGTISPHGWSITDYQKNQGFLTDLTGFIQYARARKNVSVITELDQIQSNMILIYEGNLELSEISPDEENFVLIIKGNVVIPDNLSHVFNPEKRSIAVIATGSLGINHMIREVNGILIANSYDLAHGVQSTVNPLKITGNLISYAQIENIKRERIDRLMPSVYVTFDPGMYEDLLPHLSTILLERRLLD
ncbi:hypothetical protein KBD81_04805 [Candidatus Woesebacteria bacterium]|nr:hypothetical protein [Candidatus Woesebacteria bacterium]